MQIWYLSVKRNKNTKIIKYEIKNINLDERKKYYKLRTIAHKITFNKNNI